MLALEQRARSFFLQCRASAARCKYQSSFAINRSFPRRAFATVEPLLDDTDKKKKPYYVTSPIFYVNSGEILPRQDSEPWASLAKHVCVCVC